jgi:hypothetical protein
MSAKGEVMNLLLSVLMEFLWKLWSWTVRLEIQGLEDVDEDLAKGRVPVFAVPHHTILLGALGYRGRPATLLASLSSDGEFAARFLKKRGFTLVRGSSSRGGKQALLELKNALGNGRPVAITFDGPRGPRLVPKPGVAVCAWHATGSVYLLKCEVLPSFLRSTGLCIRLNSWDRFIVPIPLSRIRVNFSKIQMPEKTQHPLEEWVPQALNSIRTNAEAFYSTTDSQ